MEKKYYVGIDLGGTFVKGGVVDEDGTILYQDKVPTEREKGAEKVMDNMATLVEMVLQGANIKKEQTVGVGVGVPGMIDSKAGVVIYTNNLAWSDIPLAQEIKNRTGLPVAIANDAHVATLGEVKFGAAKNYDNAIMLTLGTGVGGGIVIDGKLVEGNKSAGAELGHTVIQVGGEQCTCGRKGCLETYASATALIRDTKRAMQENQDSKMWEIGSLDCVTGKTAFDYKEIDASAKAVVEKYIEYLGQGIANMANIFRPEVVILGGGVCAQGDALIKPVQAVLDREIYAGTRLAGKAGIFGGVILILIGIEIFLTGIL